VEVGEALFD
jgi:hypothetical protein